LGGAGTIFEVSPNELSSYSVIPPMSSGKSTKKECKNLEAVSEENWISLEELVKRELLVS